MKRLTSIMLVFVLLLSLAFNAFAAVGQTPPDKIDSTTVWSYLDDNTDPAGNPSDAEYNRTAWAETNFDDSAWKTGTGGFGAKNGNAYSGAAVTLDGCPGNETNYPTYYFRTKVNVNKASAVTAIKGSISYDDAAIIYINGVKAAAFNESGCDTNSSYSANKANTTDNFEITDEAVLNALKNGVNVIAVEVHNHYDNSSDIWFAMNELSFSTDTVLINGTAEWKYLDNNTDPAGDSSATGYNRTSWTAEGFDTNGWKTAAGPFGSKRGSAAYDSTRTAATVLDGCDGSNNTPAYFFRTTFNIKNLERYTKLTGSLEYDDGVVVYINGQRVAAGYDNACDENGNSLGHGFDANLQYGGSNQGPDTLQISLLDLSLLHNGENTIAVELHNGRKTSGVKGKLIAVDLNENTDGDKVKELKGTEYDVKSLVSGFNYGDMTSVAVSTDGKKIAVAIQAENYAEKGVAALFSCAQDGSLTLLSTVKVGVQPDMITFADNSTILTADEGEPRDGVNGTDPKGSVSIVKIGQDNSLTANTVYFDSFDQKRDELTAKGVLIQKNTPPSTDFEPEYIAVNGNTAYISLQEANAIAVLNVASGEFTGVYPLGFQDYGETKVDLQKNDTIELKNYPNVYGIKMPDGISVTEIGGKTYLLTANEGDSRADWAGLDNEYENVTSPTGNVTLDKKVVWFNANLWDGLDSDKAYVFGGRSFSVYEATDNGLVLVYDSGSEFEEITAQKLPDYFNTSNDKTSIDNRSGKKGSEPESVVTGVISNKTFAFIALERIGGIMVYDITDPANTKFANYINSREFDEVIKGDVSPEGLCFIPASSSKTGKATLLAACEVSGTLAAYQCDYEQPATNDYKITEGANGTWTQNSDRTLTIRANGDIAKFTGIKIDGTLIDASNYTAVSGSTVVTLNADYLKTISVGTHKLTVVYTDGECSTNFEVKQADSEQTKPTEGDKTDTTTPTDSGKDNPNTGTPSYTESPQTGDNSNLALWFALLFVSGAGTLGTVAYSKRKNSIGD